MTKAEREALKAEFVTGDYRTLKEFATAKSLPYGEIRKASFQDDWLGTKKEHEEQIANKTIKKAEQKRVDDNVRNIAHRQDETLNIANSIKAVAIRLLKNPKLTAKETNSLASALYRVNEIEKGILLGKEDVSTEGIQPIIQILDCSKDGDDE